MALRPDPHFARCPPIRHIRTDISATDSRADSVGVGAELEKVSMPVALERRLTFCSHQILSAAPPGITAPSRLDIDCRR